MNAKPLTHMVPQVLRVVLAAVLLLGLAPGGRAAEVAAPLAAAPSADFTATPTNGVATLTVDFTNTSTGSYTSTQWDFGDGGTSTKQNPTHRYKTPGVYTVSLTVNGPEGSSTATKQAYITVCASAYAEFEAAPLSGVAPLAVAFTNKSCGAFSTWSWDFGDGSPASTEANPTHTYTAGGVYTVTLTASGSDGTVSKTKTNLITVYNPVGAGFAAQPTSGVAPLEVAFTNTSTGDYTARQWDFGDGATSTDQNPSHVYAAPGVYTVTLTVSGPGGTATETKTGYITAYTPVHAGFTAEPTSGIAPLSVTFSNTSTGDYTASQWDFGDGSPVSTEASPTHVYSARGTYTVTLTVSGPGGTDSVTTPACVTVYEPVQAAFTAQPTAGLVPLQVSFTNTSTGDYDTLSWDLGDGSPPSAEANPVHTYTAGGTYTVTLTTSGLGGQDVETKVGYISVYTPVQAGMVATPTVGVAPLDVAFRNTSTGSFTASEWDFGDGSPTSNELSPTHVYGARGTYTVTLSVSGPGGTDSITEPGYITVYAPVEAGFEAAPVEGIAPVTVVFTNTTTGDFTSSLWSFGDTFTSTLQSPVHTYTTGGVYTVTLTASGPGGEDTESKVGYITVYTPTQAAFTATPAGGVAPLSVQFTNTSTGDYTTSLWDFGDGITSTLKSPSHTYTAVGLYTVSLTVGGPGGTDTRVMTDLIDVYPATRDPGACNTDIAIQNLGAQTAQGSILFTTAGQDYLAWAPELGPLVPKARQLQPASQFGGDAAGAWAGAVDVASSQPVAAVLTMLWDNAAAGTRAAATYTGVASPATTAYLPLLVTAPGYRTDLTLQNTTQTQANVTIRFRDRAGGLATKALTVPAGSEVTLDLGQVPEAGFAASGGFGSAEITADRAIAVAAAVHWPCGSDAYSAAGSGATTLLAPGAVRRLGAGGRYDWSELVVQNAGDAAANVHLEFIARSGAVTHALDGTVPAHGARAYSTRDLAALGDDWQGTVKVTSSNGQPLAAICVAWAPSTGAADNLAWNAAAGATTRPLAFPAVYRKLAGANDDRWSTVLVHNAGAAGGSVDVEFYDASGTKVGGTYTIPVSAGGLALLSLKDGLDLPQAALTALGTGFSGSMWVSPSTGVQIVGVAETFWPSDGRAAAYAGVVTP